MLWALGIDVSLQVLCCFGLSTFFINNLFDLATPDIFDGAGTCFLIVSALCGGSWLILSPVVHFACSVWLSIISVWSPSAPLDLLERRGSVESSETFRISSRDECCISMKSCRSARRTVPVADRDYRWLVSLGFYLETDFWASPGIFTDLQKVLGCDTPLEDSS